MNRFNLLLLILLVQCFGCTGDTNSSVTQGDTSTTESELPMESPSKKDSSQEASASATATPPIDDVVNKNAMMLYRDAQAMMKDGNLKAGYETAEKAMAQFIEEGDDLAWMMLESIALEDKRIEVHFNMGQRERNMPKDGIVRPLSFRIWSKGDNPELLQILDFEIGRSEGQSVTAAIGEMTDAGHTNYGILDVDADYETIRQRVVDLITVE